MPDVWEAANGLNPNNASDAQAYTIDPKGWYTNIEVYCNWLVEDIMKVGNQNAIETVEEYYPTVVGVDLAQTGIIHHPTPITQHPIFYDMTGRRVNANHRGLVIERMTDGNGQTITKKYINH
jgi:hypothetical protein